MERHREKYGNSIASFRGQAMVEFVIILMIVMGLCAGMLWVSRLLTFEYWAQQEARYLAFEQTWAPHANYFDPVNEPKGKLDDGTYLHRPNLVGVLDAEKEVTNEGSVNDLLPFIVKREESEDQSDQAVMVASARTSIWNKRTREWLEGDSLVSRAFATENYKDQRSGLRADVKNLEVPSPMNLQTSVKYEDKVVNLLQRGGFGGRFCAGMAEILKNKHYDLPAARFEKSSCSTSFNKEFGIYLARSVNPRLFFQEFGENIGFGMEPQEALQETAERVIASGFYSFFDDTVKLSMIAALAETFVDRLNYISVGTDSSIGRMISEMRYVGSSIAVAAIDGMLGAILGRDPSSRNAAAEKNFEDSMNAILHEDSSLGFLLSPEYLPVPVAFGSVGAGVQSGLMKNILYKEPNSGVLINELIEDSNKMGEVRYDATAGSFSAARSRFNTGGIVLTSRFFLVTEPWHIPRREFTTGSHRAKGDQFDDIDSETDEGILRRRVHGLWLVPADVGALLDPLSNAPGFGALVQPMETALSVVQAPINLVKDLISDNPFLKIMDFLSDIPIAGDFIPTLPKWPAVRPDAYPGTKEIEDDMLTNQPRDFQKYIDEQKKYNPAANPTFHD